MRIGAWADLIDDLPRPGYEKCRQVRLGTLIVSYLQECVYDCLLTERGKEYKKVEEDDIRAASQHQ